MPRRATRKRSGKKFFSRVYSPIDHLIKATREVAGSAFRRSGRIVDNGVGFVGNVGKSVTKHANGTVRNVLRRKNRKSRKNTRKNRK